MFWGLIMEPNKRYTQEVEKSFHVSQATLDIGSSDGKPVQIMVIFAKRNYLIGTLQKDKILQIPLDLNFETGDKISFTTNGNSHVHLTGYLTPDDPYENMMDDSSEAEEEAEVPELVPIKKAKRTSDGESPVAKKSKKSELADLLNEVKSGDDSSDGSFDPENVTANDSEELEYDSDALGEEEDESDDDDDDDDEVAEEKDSDQEEETVKEEPKSVKNEKQKQKQMNGIDTDKSKNKQESAQKKKLSGGVTSEDLKVGDGKVAKHGCRVQVYYTGRLKSNNKVFDSTQKGPGFKFHLGKSEVIKGWDVGVVGMKVGGRRRLTIPPQMAYGAKGSPPVIPPNSVLVFDVELRNVLD